MTPRPDEADDPVLASAAAGERTSEHDVVRAVRAATGGRARRLDDAIGRVVQRDAELLDRLGKA